MLQSSEERLYILEADKQWVRARIAELEQQIQALGPEFYDAFNQTSETWHDNAPFEAVRDRQSVMAAELQHLRETLRAAAISLPKTAQGTVGIGSRVSVRHETGDMHYMIAGHWSPFTGQMVDGAMVITCAAPLGRALLGRVAGDAVAVRASRMRIISIN